MTGKNNHLPKNLTTNRHEPTRTTESYRNKSSCGLFGSWLNKLVVIFVLLFVGCELGGPVQLPSYTIIYNSNGGSGKMDNSTLVYGASGNLNANEFTREGYGFTGWAETPAGEVKYTDRQSVNNLTTKDGEVINLYAQWRGNSYTIVYNANGGAGSMEDSVFTYGVPQNLRDNIYTRTGYTFAGWARTSG